eukprot:scpid73442/ scgid31036/ 
MVRLLMAAGADPTVKNIDGDTALSMAPPDILPLLAVQEVDMSAAKQRPVGDLTRLSYMTRQRLAYQLDRDHSWSTLSDLLGLGSLSVGFSLRQSPTQELLLHYELNDGTVDSLKQALATMERRDALDLIDQALAAPLQQQSAGPQGAAGAFAFSPGIEASLMREVQGLGQIKTSAATTSPVAS